MANCNNCLHKDVCKYGQNRNNGAYCTGEKCKQFKDRRKYVEVVSAVMGNECFDPTLDRETDFLIANGVTVQDGKPIEAFLHPIDAYKGLKEKYLVFKADTRKKVDNCFVLRPDRDPAATEALRAYANATDNETLAEDLYNWVGKGEKVQEWISVTERLPEVVDSYIVVVKCKYDWEKEYEIGVDVATYDPYCDNPYIDGCWNTYNDWDEGQQYLHVTHWMPLPEPPKGE